MPFPKSRSKILATATAAVVSSMLAATTQAITPILVTEDFDDGSGIVEGSLSWALAQAAATGAPSTIVVTAKKRIDVMGTLNYGGADRLEIFGTGQTLRAMGDFDILAVTEGANLSVTSLNFEGPGGFDINNQSTAANPGKGIFVKVPASATGTVILSLTDVSVKDVANHGIHVSDCNLADDCGSGSGGSGGGSAASIRLVFNGVQVKNTSNGKFDADGVRVDERDDGNIIADIVDSSFEGVGADGVELDEGQYGSVIARISGSEFKGNGAYCDPDLLGAELDAFLGGADDEGEFEDGAGVFPEDLPGGGVASGFTDNRCIEYVVDTYDSGEVEEYEIAIDVDDGIDIDEAGEGSLRSLMVDSSIKDNFDEGVDYDEEDEGSIVASFVGTEAKGNTDDGYKMSEEGAGSVIGLMYDADAKDNGGAGAVFEEEDAGNVNVTVRASKTSGNDDGDGPGLEVVQEDAGTGSATVIDSNIKDGIEVEGVTLIQ